ncbi:hypothetical protein BGZ88_002233, partial [Linnemannia elongata]
AKNTIKGLFNGNTYGRIEDFATLVKKAYGDSHTWNHKDLATLSPRERVEELMWSAIFSEDAFRRIFACSYVHRLCP